MAARRRVMSLAVLLGACVEFPAASPGDAAVDPGTGGTAGGSSGGGGNGGNGTGGQGTGGQGTGGQGTGGGGGARADAGPVDAGPGGATGDAQVGPVGEHWVQVAVSGAQSEASRSSGYVPRHGGGHTCAVTSEGRLFCWGANYDGQLGLNDTQLTRVATPREVDPGTRWASVSAGLAHTCGIRAANDAEAPGGLFCWGEPGNGRLGLGVGVTGTDRPLRVGMESDWQQVSAGGGHTCGLRAGGALHCWGAASHGQLGLGQVAETIFEPRLVPGPDWTFVAAGLTHTCALQGADVLACWGAAQLGQTGMTGGAGPCSISVHERTECDPVPRFIFGDHSWHGVAVGDGHTCARDVNGEVYCFGANDQGQLGRSAACIDDNGDPRFCDWTDQLVRLAGQADVLAAGGSTSCRRTGETLTCFGEGRFGQRGNGYPDTEDDPDRPAPVAPPARGQWDKVAVGADHVCALTTLGELACFGSTADGQIGGGVFSAELRPVAVPLPGEVRDFSVGTSGAACAIVAPPGAMVDALGDLYCWGDATTGLLLDRADGHVNTPVQLTENALYRGVSVGHGFACAVGVAEPPGRGFVVSCWGQDDRGQLGDAFERSPSVTFVNVPWEMGPRDETTVVRAGSAGGCELTPNVPNGLRCWGDNREGQLGPSAVGPGPWTPVVAVPAPRTEGITRRVAVGDTRVFAIDGTGHLLGWGGMRAFWEGLPELQNADNLAAQPLDDGNDWLDIDARGDLICGLRAATAGNTALRVTCTSLPAEDGLPSSPGPDIWQQLENRRWTSFAVGPQAVCARDTDGLVSCGGDNQSGLLGDGTRDNQYLPRVTRVEAVGRTFADPLSVGDRTACGLSPQPDGPPGLYCWGHGTRGQLGTGVSDATVPVFVPIPAP